MARLGALQWPSVLVYSGLAAAAAGALSVLLPPGWLGFARRRSPLLVGILAGATLFAGGWLWPAGTFTTPAPASRLDAFMPDYSFHERHELEIEAPAEQVRAALDRVSLADIPVMQTLGRIRSIALGRGSARGGRSAMPVLEMVRNPRSNFFPLDETPGEIVFGLAGQPWNNRSVRLSPEEFRSWAEPGNVKIAANFRIEDAGRGRSRLITETRIAASDPPARRTMARYWALIYPGSGMIRRSLLEAIRARAEQPRR